MDDGERERNAELYKALLGGKHDKVIELCGQFQNGPLHQVTIHQSTVLHVAAHAKENKLVLDLLNQLPVNLYEQLTCQNSSGNTILHEAATANCLTPAARELLSRAPTLLIKVNQRGETPLFRAARYGKSRMFTLLDDQFNQDVQSKAALRTFHQRDDETTILHVAILTEHFELALHIAEKHSYLILQEDGDGMTALQLLACNPSAFRSGGTLNLLERLIYSSVSIEGASATQNEDESCCNVPFWDKLQQKKQRIESALKLAKFLISRDTTWEKTRPAISKSQFKTHRYGKISKSEFKTLSYGKVFIASQDQNLEEGPSTSMAETALFLATESGCVEIVKGILNKYPQAVEHVDGKGRNILHVAVKYRKIEILDIVEKMNIPMRRLRQKTTNEGNSILHMVGIRKREQKHGDMRSPALILQEDLLLFERIKKIMATHTTKHLNSNGQTAEELFAEVNAPLHIDAKEWMKRTAENCSIVAVLIATVAFAAAYTVPGGPSDKGYPVLENHPFFLIFTTTDVLSLGFALTSVIIFLSILTSPFRLSDFQRFLPQKLMLGVTLLIFSVSMMMLAFASTVILMIRNKEKWTRIALYGVAFFPVSIFAISYFPLYMSLMKTFKYSLMKIGLVIPRCGNPFKFVKPRTSVHQSRSKSQTICCLV